MNKNRKIKVIGSIVIFLSLGFTAQYLHYLQREDNFRNNIVNSTKVLILYDTVQSFHFSDHELKINLNNYSLIIAPLALNGKFLNNIIQINDIVFKDSNSNKIDIIRGSSTYTSYFLADTNNYSWKQKKLINRNLY